MRTKTYKQSTYMEVGAAYYLLLVPAHDICRAYGISGYRFEIILPWYLAYNEYLIDEGTPIELRQIVDMNRAKEHIEIFCNYWGQPFTYSQASYDYIMSNKSEKTWDDVAQTMYKTRRIEEHYQTLE